MIVGPSLRAMIRAAATQNRRNRTQGANDLRKAQAFAEFLLIPEVKVAIRDFLLRRKHLRAELDRIENKLYKTLGCSFFADLNQVRLREIKDEKAFVKMGGKLPDLLPLLRHFTVEEVLADLGRCSSYTKAVDVLKRYGIDATVQEIKDDQKRGRECKKKPSQKKSS